VRVATQYAPSPLLPRRAPPSRRNVAVLSHAEYVPTLTAAAALRVKAVLSKNGLVTFDLLTLRVVSESRVTWATTSLPILVFLGLTVHDLGPMYATDRRQTDVRQKHRLMPRLLGRGHNKYNDGGDDTDDVIHVLRCIA